MDTFDKHVILTAIFIFCHAIVVIPTGYVILFNNNIKIVFILTIILFLVYLQVIYVGCILNRFENNASIKILLRLSNLQNISESDFTQFLVLGTLLTCSTKLFILFIFPQVTSLTF